MSDRQPPKRGVALFAHGSRNPRWKAPFLRLEETVSLAMPDRMVRVAYLQDCDPKLDRVIDEMANAGIGSIIVVPFFLAVGAHSRNDFPKIEAKLKKNHPDVDIRWTDALGEWEETTVALSGVVTAKLSGLS